MLLLLLYSRELICAHCCVISTYAKAKYKRYHAVEDGQDQIVAAAAGASALPSVFSQTIKAAPTPAEVAVRTVRENDPATLSFSDVKLIGGLTRYSPGPVMLVMEKATLGE